MRVEHVREYVGTRTGFETAATDVSHAEREESLRRHQPIRFGADVFAQKFRMLLDRVALRYFQRGPETIVRSRRRAIGRADHDVPGERVDLRHILERGVELLRWNLPRNERTVREVRREQRLPYATDRARREHRADAFDRRVEIDAGAARDLAERIAHEAGDPVFGDAQDRGVDRILDGDGWFEYGHVGLYATARPKPRWDLLANR